jgi:uncharacterized protein YbjT (DUF2867 family)
MTERRVVLFGGSGFVGRHLAPRLAHQGWTVQVASRHPRQDASAADNRVVAVAADLGEEDQVRRAVSGVEAVINLAGIARAQDAGFEAVHVEGAARVARLAAAAGVRRLLHISALGIAEDAPSMADHAKARGEAAVRAAFPAAMLVRPSLIDGPGDHFFTRFAAMAKMSPVLPVIGGGRTRFQPLHIADAVRTLEMLLERPETAGSTLALVGSETFTLRALLERLLAVLGRRRLILPLSFPAAEALAAGVERLPDPSLTREEVRLLRTDKVAWAWPTPTPTALGLAARRLAGGLPVSLQAG